jgi:pantoate--beta-alanine ligase
MIITQNNTELFNALANFRLQGKTIGFVPTMGALHPGHLSLIEGSKKSCDITVCSIFVNPTQFNDKKDLEKYPRTEEADLNMLSAGSCDVVYLPSVDDIYPADWICPEFDFGNLDKVMEGAHRPGHFKGMSQVVHRLLWLVQPDKLFMGQKDFQQQTIVKKMLELLNWNVELVRCEIIREKDGLAMSSRNVLLNQEERQQALAISKTLLPLSVGEGQGVRSKFPSPVDFCVWAKNELQKNSLFQVEYVEIVDTTTLQAVDNWNTKQELVCCVAAKVGEVRLIDNVLINL